MKTFLFAAALASLALAGGCATGGNGTTPPPVTIDVSITSPSGANPNALYPTEPVTVTATVSNSKTTAVTWTCTPAGAPCANFAPVTPPTTPATAKYVAPTTPTSGVTVTATLAADSTKTGNLPITVIDVTTDVAPATLSVGQGLTQTFTAVAVPDDAGTQNFTWTCTAGGAPCTTFSPAPNVPSPGLAYYTANDTCNTKGCVQISAAAVLASPTACAGASAGNCTIATATLVPSRVSGTYAFRFSGYDSSNHAVAVAGTFTATSGANGTATITGLEDELTSSSGPVQRAITGTYTPISSSDPNSNNAGTIALALPGIYPNQYQVVLDGAGDIEMIESDGKGTGSGIAQISATPTQISQVFSKTPPPIFAFGFTGVDSGGSRVGYAGLLPMSGTAAGGTVANGLIDVNDNGNSINSICGAPPCGVTGTYTQTSNVSWHVALSSPVNMGFDLFVASGTTNKATPLTFYAISTDGGVIPAVSGTMVLEDSTLTYDTAHFKGTSVTALTGTALTATTTCTAPPCANVSLTLGTTDGKGNFAGQFDQNNGGAILSAAKFPPSSGTNNYTYAANSNSGRYTFNLLGDPTATTPVAPIPFVLYATGANRGFLLDTSSQSVITGTMSPQGNPVFGFPGSALPSTFAAATTSSGSSAVDAIADNLLLTWANTGACTAACVNGTQYDATHTTGETVTGANPGYTLQSTGNGTIVLTAPSAQNYVIYALDISGCTKTSPVCAVQSFFMMDETTTPNPDTNASIIFAQQ